MCYNPEGREITLVDRGPPRPLSLLSGLLREVLGVPEAGEGREDARGHHGVRPANWGRQNPAPIPDAQHGRNP